MIAISQSLGFHTLTGVHHQQSALASKEGARHLIGEVDVAWGINEVKLVGLTILGLVLQGHSLSFNGDTALALNIHGVEDLSLHLTGGQTAAFLNKAIG